MNITKIIDKIDRDYFSIPRNQLDPETPYLLIGKNLNTAEIIEGVIYVEGNTTNTNFWRVVRNAEIKHSECNDDFQFDSTAINFQKDLLKKGIVGKIKFALIGLDETTDELVERYIEAIKKGFIPIGWDWCNDYWIVNDSHVDKWKKQKKLE